MSHAESCNMLCFFVGIVPIFEKMIRTPPVSKRAWQDAPSHVCPVQSDKVNPRELQCNVPRCGRTSATETPPGWEFPPEWWFGYAESFPSNVRIFRKFAQT